MHADGPRAVGPHGKPVEASAGSTASDVGDIWKSVSKNLKFPEKFLLLPNTPRLHPLCIFSFRLVYRTIRRIIYVVSYTPTLLALRVTLYSYEPIGL